jgi:hypothetical protein
MTITSARTITAFQVTIIAELTGGTRILLPAAGVTLDKAGA